VVVPGVVVGIGDFGPDHFDDARAGFDQAAGQQAALAEGIAAVFVASGVGFLREVEGVAGAAGRDEAQRALVVFIEVFFLDSFFNGWHLGVDHVAELGAALHADGEDVGPHLEVVDLDVVHLGHVHVVAVGKERVRVEALAEEAGGAAFADDVALLQRPWQHNEWEHRFGRRFDADDL